jgi:hypothetical protein
MGDRGTCHLPDLCDRLTGHVSKINESIDAQDEIKISVLPLARWRVGLRPRSGFHFRVLYHSVADPIFLRRHLQVVFEMSELWRTYREKEETDFWHDCELLGRIFFTQTLLSLRSRLGALIPKPDNLRT